MLRRIKILLPLFLTLITAETRASGARLPHPAPPTELCGGAIDAPQSAELICNDPRLGAEKENYKRLLMKGDLCTNPDDFKTLQTYVLELRTKLAKYEKSCKL